MSSSIRQHIAVLSLNQERPRTGEVVNKNLTQH
jgi:hypothetical protein